MVLLAAGMLAAGVLASLSSTSSASTARTHRAPAKWQKLLLTPLQLQYAEGQAAESGSRFFYYDRPRHWTKPEPVDGDGGGGKPLCAQALGDYDEMIRGDLVGNDTGNPASFYITVYVFKNATAAHREFACLKGERTNLSSHGTDFWTDMPRSAGIGQEVFGGGSDEGYVGAIARRSKYILLVTVQHGYGPLTDVMSSEDILVKDFGG
jgi:hypothetical protein